MLCPFMPCCLGPAWASRWDAFPGQRALLFSRPGRAAPTAAGPTQALSISISVSRFMRRLSDTGRVLLRRSSVSETQARVQTRLRPSPYSLLGEVHPYQETPSIATLEDKAPSSPLRSVVSSAGWPYPRTLPCEQPQWPELSLLPGLCTAKAAGDTPASHPRRHSVESLIPAAYSGQWAIVGSD